MHLSKIRNIVWNKKQPILGCFLFVLFFEKIVKNARLKGGEGSPNGMALVFRQRRTRPWWAKPCTLG
ncbi:hypothetical protein A3A11_02730 [Candidatus Nomurabacteria bacterium RIFCSPLOWO2_01_FULL_43_15]|nr:MAG: hypothetical protein A3A11_02730 [Candidatus Nomurabacteria bacterium RIFCSPLOWO2_01_FULL_43_15]